MSDSLAAEPPAAAPLDSGAFAAALDALGPFEPAPRLAVAVSGGADSMALALLAADWAKARGGRVTALTVDHGLRPESAAEATAVGERLGPFGIAHRILVWRPGGRPANLQAAAREARYALMDSWCRAEGVLHLLLGHHLEDQAETLLIRLGRGSGLDGLAAMAPVVETPHCRLLRPLLGVPRARLAALLAARGVGWIEDPSNRDARFLRARLRALAPALAEVGLTPDRLAATAGRIGRARAALEEAVAAALVEAVRLDPAGFALLDPAALRRAPREVGLRALARVVTTVGGGRATPRLARLEALFDWLTGDGRAGRGRTLAGCRILVRRAGVLVCRELRAVAAPVAVLPGRPARWDDRFEVTVAGPAAGRRLTLGALGRDGWAEAVAARPELRRRAPPAPVRATLPALRDDDGLVAVPHLAYRRAGGDADSLGPCRVDCRIGFSPGRALAGARFVVV